MNRRRERGVPGSARPRARALAAAVAIAGIVLAGLVAPNAATPAEAVTGADFNAGNIVSDAVFYDPNALTVAQIQAFLNSKVPACAAGYTCLNRYTETTWTRAADAQCNAYVGAPNQTAAEIIWNVGQACGISPAALIVLLQKEQGLVTHSSPSATRYGRATGYACPDTAPCDAQFYGFYNQVYKAAWQFERYRLVPQNFSYRAGRVNSILWNPNGNCGRSDVYIENAATAGLYNYTPYRPNQAALNNLYGTGDGCSSYGNRNFWRIYSDWFGDPTGGGPFLRTQADETVYLVAGTMKYRVPDLATLTQFSVLGGVRFVTPETLASYTTGNVVGTLVRDAITQNLYYYDGGVRHFVPTCAMLVEFGTTCPDHVDLMPSQIGKMPLGAPLSTFVVKAGTDFVYHVQGGTRRWMSSMDEVIAANGGEIPAFTTLTSSALDRLAFAPTTIAAGRVITADGTSWFLRDGAGAVVPVSAVVRAEAGLAAPLRVPADVLGQYTQAGAPLALAVSCGSDSYLAGSGRIWRLTAPAAGGLPVTALDAATCAALPQSTTVVPAGALLVRSPASGEIYVVEAGAKRFVSTMAALTALGGSSPVWVDMSGAALATIPTGLPVLGSTQLVKAASSPTVYVVDGARKIPVSSFAITTEFGIPSSPVSTQTTASLDLYPTASEPLPLAVTCGADTYLAGSGRIWKLASGSSAGLPVTALDPATCGALRVSATVMPSGPLLVRSPSSGEIYLIEGGTKRFVSSMAALTSLAGSSPVWVDMGSAALGTIPTGSPVLGPTQLVKASSSPTVYFIDGTRKLPVSSFAITTEFGVSSSTVSTQAASLIDGYPTASAPLTLAVTCGSDTYLAGSGAIWKLSSGAASGLPVTALDPATCGSLRVSATPVPSGPLLVRAPSGEIYLVENGARRFVTTMAALTSLAGPSPVWVPMGSAALATIPIGSPLS